jgi:hypothetical protein
MLVTGEGNSFPSPGGRDQREGDKMVFNSILYVFMKEYNRLFFKRRIIHAAFDICKS